MTTTLTQTSIVPSTTTTTETDTITDSTTQTQITTATDSTTNTIYSTSTLTTTLPTKSTSTIYTTYTETVPTTTTSTTTSTSTSTSYTTSTQTIPTTTTTTQTDTTVQTSTATQTTTTVVTSTSVVTTSVPLYSSNGCVNPSNNQSGITCKSLFTQAVAWKPKINASIGWTVQFTNASYNNIFHASSQTLLNELNMLVQSGATCIRIDIGFDAWLESTTAAQNARSEITYLVNQIRADGKCLIIADAGANSYRTSQITLSQFENASYYRVQTLANLYHPDFYIVIKEPYWYFPMISDNKSATINDSSTWSQLAQNLTNAVQKMSPTTVVGVSTSFQGPNSSFVPSFLTKVNLIPNLGFIGFDVYTAKDFNSTQNYATSGLTKNIWIAEAWSTSNPVTALSPDRASLDQLWIQDLYYFGLNISATNISPFYTNSMSSYSMDNTNYSNRTAVFYEFQHLATTYDGRVH